MRTEVNELIKPNDWLTSLERLEIYSRSYWFRILDGLYEDFPGLAAVLGQRAFHRLARAYLPSARRSHTRCATWGRVSLPGWRRIPDSPGRFSIWLSTWRAWSGPT